MQLPTMQRAAAYSFVAHIVFLTFVVLLSSRAPKSKATFYTVKLVEQSPKKTVSKTAPTSHTAKAAPKPEQPQNRQKVVPKPPQPEHRQKVVPKKEPTPAPKPAPAAPSIEEMKAQRLKALQQKVRQEEQEAAQKERDRQKQESLERIRKEAAARSAAEQDATNQAEYNKELGEYQTTVTYAIYEQWVYPDIVDVKQLHAEISITVQADGSIKINRFERPSGNRPFDRSCLKAIADAGTVPPPPFGKPIEFIVRFIPE